MTTTFPRYKVVSEDGLGMGSKIIDLETGLPIAQVAHVTLHAGPDDIWRADVQLVGVAVDINLIEFRPRRFLWRRVRGWFRRTRTRLIAFHYINMPQLHGFWRPRHGEDENGNIRMRWTCCDACHHEHASLARARAHFLFLKLLRRT